MSAEGRFRASGWRGREVEIPRAAGRQGPILLEFTGGLTSIFQVDVLRRSATRKDHGGQLLRVYGPRVHRALLPVGYDRVVVTRVRPRSSSGSGVSRWRLRTVEAAELPVLTGTLSGKVAGLVYFDARARVSFVWQGSTEHGELRFTSVAGFRTERLSREGATRGVVTVPGSGFLTVSTLEKWTLERR